MKEINKNLQEDFLIALCKEQVNVSIYLINGIKLRGKIESFDRYVVILKNATSQVVYKHAISTIAPDRAVQLNQSQLDADSNHGEDQGTVWNSA